MSIFSSLPAITVELVKSFEGKPRLKAEKDMLGNYEIGYGNTYFADGKKVKEGDIITPANVDPLLAFAMATEAKPILDAMMTSTLAQRAAFTSLGYNCGGYNILKQSRALKLHNSNIAALDVAAAFSGGWYSGTSLGPTKRERSDPYYDGIWTQTHTGDYVWIGPDGEPCAYRQLIRGLLRRRLAEGCVYMGKEFRQACTNDAVSLIRRRVWDGSKGIWADRLVSRTSFADVYEIAKNHPLTEAQLQPVDGKAEPQEEPQEEPEKPPVGTKEVVIVPTDHEFDGTVPAKPMETSETFVGAVIEVVGTFLKRRSAQGGITGTVGTSVLTLYLAVMDNPVMLAAATTVVIAAVSGVVWSVGKAMEVSGFNKKEKGRDSGVQYKY